MENKQNSTVNELLCVAEFMQMTAQKIESSPKLIGKKTSKFRFDLINEEVKELKEAISDNNIIEIADALIDIEYTVKGAILAFGLGSCYNELFNEIQRSNMSKFCKTHEDAIKTLEFYEKEKGIFCEIIDKKEYYLVQNIMDGKQLKCVVNYSKPNLGRILENHEEV